MDRYKIVFSALVCIATGSAAWAGPILQPLVITSAFGSYPQNPLSHIIDQSGLSAGYISGVTDFDSYTMATIHDQTTSSFAVGFTDTPGLPQEFSLDLGSYISIDGLGYWGFYGLGTLLEFDLHTDTDMDIANGIGNFIGSFNPDLEPGADVFSFGAIDMQYLQLIATDAGFPGAYPGIGEVAFRSAVTVEPPTVPIPATLPLVGFALGILGCSRRKWLSQRYRIATTAN